MFPYISDAFNETCTHALAAAQTDLHAFYCWSNLSKMVPDSVQKQKITVTA